MKRFKKAGLLFLFTIMLAHSAFRNIDDHIFFGGECFMIGFAAAAILQEVLITFKIWKPPGIDPVD